jgi:hypothetical protein
MKASKLRRLGEGILGVLLFVPWAVCAHYISLGLTALGFRPHWAVLVVSVLVGFAPAFLGFVAVVGLVHRH